MPKLIKNSIEDINFNQVYNGIIVPLGSFQLFHPRETAFAVLKKFHRALKSNGKLVMDLFIPWESLYENNSEERSNREVNIDDHSIIKIESHTIANKHKQYIECHSVYTKWSNNQCIAEEKEHMHIHWYYLYEMQLVLEKYGFKNITYYERFLNQENMTTFIAEKDNNT